MLRHHITFIVKTPDGKANRRVVADWAREQEAFFKSQDLGLPAGYTIHLGSIESFHPESEG